MRSERIACAVSLVLLAAASAGYAVFYMHVARTSALVAARAREVETKSADIRRADTIDATLAEIEAGEAAVRRYYVPETGVAAFIDDLEARGRAVGATVEIASVEAAPKGKPEMFVTLAIEGSFDAVMRAFGSIEYAPYALAVTGMNLAQSTESPWRADLTLSIGSATTTASTQ